MDEGSGFPPNKKKEKVKMQKIEVKKLTKVNAPVGENGGIVAFQLVEIKINFYGQEMISTFDTKIMDDGNQYVIDGDGFIPSGFIIN